MTELDPRELRRAFGGFMTGVTVVTMRNTSGMVLGFTANSFTSVSLDPPLLLVCPGKSLSSYHEFSTCNRFAVNILAEGQEDVSNTFAGFKGDRFAKVEHTLDTRGIPLITDAVATFSCKTHKVVEAGDHCVLIGQVEAYNYTEIPALGFANGRYFSLGLERGALEPTGLKVVCGAIIEHEGRVLLEKTEAGFRPPQVTLSDRRQLRDSLRRELHACGVDAHLGVIYSVYDDPTTHHVYTLAKAPDIARPGDLDVVAIKDLATLSYATQPIATMMARYALESRTRDFSLYLGSALQGDTHGLSERN
ncbi:MULTISPECIES: flavin reductase family protein [unclassified Ruegeria]|uniref:flavin reductase family protein n=1 Tax=unclassified Ruegeria TaxID=2625375 RepID=UPI00148997A6|nr:MULTISPECIES: flavin reductase family protein [unclassified Ruegeria]NOD75612.1 flavin reductase [Ruegeria sp. HKCCD4332]NOD90982.1 flavin reductase [Ruegeria sp. HKCCD4318]NOE16360.1 flavin reductase [Ruegeria sp. HKCCD4318-2]NOG10151.1 flavin reductase [Ruegeria sp. HKCCD4315]